MKLNRLLFQNKDYFLEGDIDFSNLEFDPYHIKKIGLTHVKITGSVFEDLLMLNFHIVSDVIGVCAYTLEDVPLHFDFKDSLEISNEIEDDEKIFFEKNMIFDIDPYVLSLLVSEIPAKIVKKGAKLPEDGTGYRVLSEEEYEKEQANKKDSRWNVLDDIDLD